MLCNGILFVMRLVVLCFVCPCFFFMLCYYCLCELCILCYYFYVMLGHTCQFLVVSFTFFCIVVFIGQFLVFNCCFEILVFVSLQKQWLVCLDVCLISSLFVRFFFIVFRFFVCDVFSVQFGVVCCYVQFPDCWLSVLFFCCFFVLFPCCCFQCLVVCLLALRFLVFGCFS